MNGLQERLIEELDTKTRFVIGGIAIPDSVFVSWLIMAFLVIVSILLTRRMKRVPGRAQMAAELFVGFINGFVKDTLGEKYWRTFAPYLGTVGLYIACANLCGILGATPPTKDLNVTAALALMSMLLIYGAAFYYKGLKGGLRQFAEPMILIAPLNVMEIAIRPLSLCMRLFGNVLGSFVVMELIKAVVPAVIPLVFSAYFDIFDGIIQTIVFVFLTTLFLKESLE